MQEEPIQEAAREFAQTELATLNLLLLSAPSAPWSMRELALALGSRTSAEDAVVHLHAAGLVHRIEEFVFPTRAAARLHQLIELS